MSVAPGKKRAVVETGSERSGLAIFSHHPGLALTGWGWTEDGTFVTQGPRHSGGPGQGHNPHSSHRHCSWLGEPSRRLLRNLQTLHPGRETESVKEPQPHLGKSQALTRPRR
jgi:hypothetical protein